MALHQEPLADAIARGDRSIRFEADAGEEQGPYDPSVFSIARDGELHVADRMHVEGTTLAIYFPLNLQQGDEVMA